MSSHAYSADQLVEQPAIGLFATLGWQTVSALEETFGAGDTSGRETKGRPCWWSACAPRCANSTPIYRRKRFKPPSMN